MGLNAVTLFRYVRRKTFQKNKICFLKCLAGVAGFEPTGAGIKIPCLTAWRHPSKSKWGGRQVSNLLPPEPQSGALPIELRPPFTGAPGEIRTPDTRLRRPLLYPTELQAHYIAYALMWWSGWWESDPRNQLGRLVFYHWTTPALLTRFAQLNATKIITNQNFAVNSF